MNVFKNALIFAGVIGLGSIASSPAFAGPLQAYGSGSSTLVFMNGSSQSIGAEIAAPRGAGFVGFGGTAAAPNGIVRAAVAVGGATANLSDNVARFNTLTVSPGTADLAVSASSSVEAAVATLITNNTTGGPPINAFVAGGLSNISSIVRAWQSGLN